MPETEEDWDDEYFYRSAGGCPRCDAMEGYYPTEPSRPHPNCQCEIERVDSTLTRPWFGDRSGHQWYFHYESQTDTPEDLDGDGYHETHPIQGRLYVVCCDGTVFDEEITVELILGPNDDTIEEQEQRYEEWFQRMEAKAQLVIATNCTPCAPPVS